MAPPPPDAERSTKGSAISRSRGTTIPTLTGGRSRNSTRRGTRVGCSKSSPSPPSSRNTKAALEKSSLQMATMVQKKADAEVLRLVEDQKREKEAALAKKIQLERQLDQKQQLELEIEQLKGKLRVMKHLGEEDDADMQKKMEELNEKLEAEKEHLEDLNSTLISKERKSNDELQEARKKLIAGLDDMLTGKTIIGIKRMRELDEKPFQVACKKRFKGGEVDTKAAELVSFWQEELKNPAWHPFKIIECDGDTKYLNKKGNWVCIKDKKHKPEIYSNPVLPERMPDCSYYLQVVPI